MCNSCIHYFWIACNSCSKNCTCNHSLTNFRDALASRGRAVLRQMPPLWWPPIDLCRHWPTFPFIRGLYRWMTMDWSRLWEFCFCRSQQLFYQAFQRIAAVSSSSVSPRRSISSANRKAIALWRTLATVRQLLLHLHLKYLQIGRPLIVADVSA